MFVRERVSVVALDTEGPAASVARGKCGPCVVWLRA